MPGRLFLLLLIFIERTWEEIEPSIARPRRAARWAVERRINEREDKPLVFAARPERPGEMSGPGSSGLRESTERETQRLRERDTIQLSGHGPLTGRLVSERRFDAAGKFHRLSRALLYG